MIGNIWRVKWKTFEKCEYVSKALYNVSDLKNFSTRKFFFFLTWLANQPPRVWPGIHGLAPTCLQPAALRKNMLMPCWCGRPSVFFILAMTYHWLNPPLDRLSLCMALILHQARWQLPQWPSCTLRLMHRYYCLVVFWSNSIYFLAIISGVG
jgi:hypothetical protein